MDDLATAVRVWWTALAMLAVCNVCFWAYAAVAFVRRTRTAPQAERTRYVHVLLSGGYVLGTALLWLLPRASMHRYALVDSWLSNAFLGRSIETIAALCFLTQWTLLLREYARAETSSFAVQVSHFILPLGVGTQVVAWYGIATQNHAALAVEQALWAVLAGATAAALLQLASKAFHPLRSFLILCLMFCCMFALYACTVDVPLHLARYRAGLAHGLPYLSFGEGLRDMAHRTLVSRDYAAWRQEISWNAAYTSVTLWLSIAFIHAPISRHSFDQTPAVPSIPTARRLSELPTNPRRLLKH